MLEQTFNTQLPLDLEVVIPSGDIEIETADGEESRVTVDGDERLLADVEISQDGNRIAVTYRGKGKLGFSFGPFFGGNDLKVRATIPHGANVKVKTASADIAVAGRLGSLDVNAVSGDVRVSSAGGSIDTKTVSGDIRCDAVSDGDVRFSSVSGDIEIGIATGSFVDVDAGSTSGDLTSEVPLGHDPVPGERNGGRKVVVRGRTISGDVRIFRAA